MQLKHKFFLIFCIISIKIFAQKPIELIGGKQLYDSIYRVNYNNVDELQKVNKNGTLLIKIDLLKGKVKNIKFSSQYPVYLVALLEKVLENTSVSVRERKLTQIIIPIFYNYQTSISSSMADLIKQLPVIDINNLPPISIKEDYDDFLGIESEKNKIKGINCVFLPWIRLSGKIQ